MAGISLEFDAAGSNIDGTNPGTALALSTANGYALLSFEAPEPDQTIQWAGSIDTEGDLAAASKSQNRVVTARYRLTGATDAALESSLNTLDKKIEKLGAESGTLKVTTPAGTVGIMDVRQSGQGFSWDHRFTRVSRTEVVFTITCAPHIRAASETDLGDNTETTLPVLIWSESIPGTVDAFGRAVIDDDSGNNQWCVFFGVEDDSQYTHTTSSGSGALFYEAESRTALGGASVVTGASGASGGASNNVVRQASLTTAYQAMLSTQASGGGAHLSHVGVFNVFARIQMPTTNTGAVSLAFEWAQGDFRQRTTNPAVTFSADHSREGQWIYQRLGQVRIVKATQGTHRWEGRIIAKSTVSGDDLDVDYIVFMPVKAYGEAMGVVSFAPPTTFDARDEFDQSAGALTGKTAPVGGTWAGAGDADDFSVNATAHTIERTANSDSANTGRYVILGSSLAGSIMQADLKWSSSSGSTTTDGQGAFLRYVDTNNWLMVFMLVSSTAPDAFRIVKRVGGTITTIYSQGLPSFMNLADLAQNFNVWFSLRLAALASGQWVVWGWRTGDALPTASMASGFDADLVTGGTLASGKGGVYDIRQQGTGSVTRSFDNFVMWSVPADAAMFASQSLQISHKAVEREDSSGTFWNRVSSYKGNYLLLPPARNEGRSTRFIVKAVRNDPDQSVDSGIDDISARVLAIPRWRSIPD